ncbi:MAG TPA: chemotaxis protein CheW [Candidatus Binatia bacterium]|jgi:purine-binding chemotaxis protein CheW|nr:chemotaxis protein CheW [Candidatus Binatia bacterium]
MVSHPHLLFRLNNSVFAVDALAVREIIRLPELTPIEEAPGFFVGVVDLRGRILPVMDLDLRFGRARRPYHIQDYIVVLEWEQILTGLIVNEVLDVRNIAAQEIVPKPAYGQVTERESSFIAGIAKLDQGLAMLLHLERLLSWPGNAMTLSIQDAASLPAQPGEPAAMRIGTPEETALFRERARSLRQPIEMHDREGLMPLAVVGLNREYFAVDLAVVREFTELREVAPVPCCPPHIVGQLNLRGDILTVVDIRAALTMSSAGTSAASKIMVVEVKDLVAGVVVNEVWDVVYLQPSWITAGPIGARSSGAEYVKGTAPYGEKMVSLLDLAKILTCDDLVVNEEV